MAVQSQSARKIIGIARNVTGRTDASDPAFTDTIMLRYLNDFLQNYHPQELRLFEDRTWWEFQIDPTTANPYPVSLDQIGFSTIGPPAYIDGFQTNWYQDPALFYARWPETQQYAPQRPTYILYYNNSLTFRNPPDKEYLVKVQANKISVVLDESSNLDYAYLYRYLAYGMSLDIFSDYGEMDRYAEVMPVYNKYKKNCLARTWQQMNSQRATPKF